MCSGQVDVELAKMLRPPGVNGLGIGITERDAAR